MDSCTALACDGKTIEWSRADKTRDGFAMISSGRLPPIPTSNMFTDAADFEKALQDYAKAASGQTPESATIAMPTSDVIFRVSRFPTVDMEEIAAMSRNQMEKDAPLPIEEMTDAFEVLSSDDESSLVLSACAPMANIESIRSLVGIGTLRVNRIGTMILGTIHNLAAEGKFSKDARDILLVEEGAGIVLVVADSGTPLLIRSSGILGTTSASSLLNAARIALIQVQLEHGQKDLSHVVCAAASPAMFTAAASVASGLGLDFRQVSLSSLPPSSYGIAVRTISGSNLNLFPETWRAKIAERTFARHMRIIIAGVAVVWLLCVLALYGWPAFLDQRIRHLNNSVEKLAAAESHVNDFRNRIQIIEKYSDRTYSPIEALLEIAVNLPPGVEMSSYRYNGEKNHISIEGKSQVTTLVYEFMEALTRSDLFDEVKLVSGPTLNRGLNVFVFEFSITFRSDKESTEEGGAKK